MSSQAAVFWGALVLYDYDSAEFEGRPFVLDGVTFEDPHWRAIEAGAAFWRQEGVPGTEDLLGAVRVAVPRDPLIAALRTLYQQRESCPRFVDVCQSSRVSPFQLIARYGSWEAVVSQFAALHPELDVLPLELPSILAGLSPAEYGDVARLRDPVFRDCARKCAEAARSAFEAFKAIADVPRTAGLRLPLVELRERLYLARSGLADLLAVLSLSLRVAGRTDLPSATSGGSDSSASMLGDAVAARLADMFNDLTAYAVPRAFARIERNVAVLAQLCLLHPSGEDTSGLEALYAEVSLLDRRFEDVGRLVDNVMQACGYQLPGETCSSNEEAAIRHTSVGTAETLELDARTAHDKTGRNRIRVRLLSRSGEVASPRLEPLVLVSCRAGICVQIEDASGAPFEGDTVQVLPGEEWTVVTFRLLGSAARSNYRVRVHQPATDCWSAPLRGFSVDARPLSG